MFTRSKCICLLSLILCCAGCVKSPFARPRNLKPLNKETARDVQTKEQATVYAKKLNIDDQQELFGKYAKQLQKFHIVPVQVTVENNSAMSLVLADKNIALNKLTIDQVDAKLFASRRWIPLWIFLGGVACTAIIVPLVGIASFHWYMAPIYVHTIDPMCAFGAPFFSAGAAIVAGGVLFAATSCITIVDAVSYHMSKKEMQRYLKTCCNVEGITLAPDITASMLFFAEESQIPEKLKLLLTDKNLEKPVLPFELAL